MEQTEQGNRLIAEYMGLEFSLFNAFIDGVDEGIKLFVKKDNVWLLCNYHSDWNDLMPVVLKIMRETDGSIQIYLNGSVLSWGISKVIDATNPDPILAVWECVVQYIKNSKQ